MTEPLRVLMLEDSPADAELIERALHRAGLVFRTQRVASRETFVEALETFRPQVVLACDQLPRFDGLQALGLVREQDAELPFIFVIGALGEEAAVEALHRGADDYISKDRLGRLPVAVERCLEQGRRRAESREAIAELRASETRFHTVFEQAAVGMAIAALDGHWLRVNQRLCDILGYDREELLTLTFIEVTHPDDREHNRAVDRQLMAGEASAHSWEKRYLRKDGTPVWVNVTITLVRRADGSPDYFIGVVQDIQARKEAEEALSRFFEQPSSLNAIATLSGVIYRLNSAWETVFGYSRAELEGARFMDYVHPDDRAATEQELQRLAAGETTYHFESRYRHRDGSYRTLSWSAIASPEQGLIFAVAHDITDIKSTLEDLEARNAELVRFNEATVDRELAMVELKLQVNELSRELGRPPPYAVTALEDPEDIG